MRSVLAKDPDVVNTESLKSFVGSSFASRAVRLLYLLQKAKERGELPECASPERLLEWSQAHQIEVPPELSRSVEEHAADRKATEAWFEEHDWYEDEDNDNEPELRPTPTEKPGWVKERDSLWKMVIAMAVDAYRYDPRALKSDVPRQIVDALQKLGIPLDADTVRKHLKAAADLVEPDAIHGFASGAKR